MGVDRYWCPRDRGMMLDGFGYLADPGASTWLDAQTPDVVATGNLPRARCLVLLGEPGIGKSAVLAEHAPLLPAGIDCPVRRVDLTQYGEERLVREVLEGPQVQEWVEGDAELCLVLDGFDEGLLHIPQLGSILAARLRSWPCNRLWLRIACRTAHWPRLMESTVSNAFPEDQEVFELLPLRRSDVAELASEWTEPMSFMAAIESEPVKIFWTVSC